LSNIKPTLVILAAGMGSRYGGLKQLDTFTPEGATIIDFSIYDALQAGFGKFVFIIRKSFEKEFKEVFNKKIIGKAEISYVFQEIDSVPEKYQNSERTKPWGTGHAMMMVKDVVNENFAIINADDFYGKEAFQVMAKKLRETNKDSYDFSTMAYLLKNTVSDHGFVSRGECQVDNDGYLIDLTERTHIEKVNESLIRKDENVGFIPISGDTVVSMNFWGFTPKCFEFGNALLDEFYKRNQNNLKAEFFLPLIVSEMIKSKMASIKVLKSNSKWFGVTYKEDKEKVQKDIELLRKQNIYPSKLW
jgi:NDP-sugar pyrophosphorylase family protein|tara:strand:- start:228 stop:1136 length:909 start_codon:yes stop_codon:yes gene_type:complete